MSEKLIIFCTIFSHFQSLQFFMLYANIRRANYREESTMLNELTNKVTKDNVIEGMCQTLIREAARCGEMADRILYGDGWALAGEPADAQPRPMTEKASVLFQELEKDLQTLVSQAKELAKDHSGHRPLAYGLKQSQAGEWIRLTSMKEAFRQEKLKARERWMRSQANSATTHVASRAEDEMFV